MVVTEPQTEKEFTEYYRLRWEVLRKPWGHPEGSEKDDQENTSIHAAIFGAKGEALGVCRLQFNDAQTGQVRFMGVRDDQQGKGLGNLLMDYMEKKAKARGAVTMILHARENAVPFYIRNGYRIKEKSHLLWGVIQHYLMEKTL